MLNWLNFVVLAATLGVLVWYAFDTHRIANQTVETNLRPIVLRSGIVGGWDDVLAKITSKSSIDNKPLEFISHKNLVQRISGYVLVEGNKHKLFFGNDVSFFTIDSDNSGQGIRIFPEWGWLPPGGKVYAFRGGETPVVFKGENHIYLEYYDVEGNKYFTLEDQNFVQKTGRL